MALFLTISYNIYIYMHMYIYIYAYIYIYIYCILYFLYILGYPDWNKHLPLRSVSTLVKAPPLNTALIRVVTIFYWKLNQNANGTSIQTIKQLKYCWFLDFFIMQFIDSENLCFIFILKEKNDKVFSFNIFVYFCNLCKCGTS